MGNLSVPNRAVPDLMRLPIFILCLINALFPLLFWVCTLESGMLKLLVGEVAIVSLMGLLLVCRKRLECRCSVGVGLIFCLYSVLLGYSLLTPTAMNSRESWRVLMLACCKRQNQGISIFLI